jgi:branched-subunit amino acid transport protein AzlD
VSRTAVVLAGLAAGTYALKAAGPLVLGGRPLPAWLDVAARRLPAALLAALVVVSTVVDGQDLVLDARAVGVLTAGVALRLRAPMALAVLAAVAATAAARAIT